MVIVSISVVLRLSATRGCTLHSGPVVDHECDTLIESFVVHLLSVGQVGPGYYRKHPLLVSFLK